MVVEMQDEEILSVHPETIVGYTHSAVGGTQETRPYR